ncbi:ImmA/IrrE family metallo-endopeptidase [Microbacterium halotolerans]|uniref:ImmA/IrrE family metallo-endopeptidase n=1 Tax=Microbacterium halotolerans TaxID=246613 RepID=UPI000E6A97C3|nr:ImmA/IrrE family metallo-endopeptidase [Microbacterium halotolerans]
MKELLRLAADHGVAVTSATLPDDLLGCYVPDLRRIYLDSRLTPSEERSVLAHELGHVHYAHPCGDDAPSDTARARERQADVFAARLLIDTDAYARLERVDADAHAIADDLGVTVELVEIYRTHCLQRVGNSARALPRPGRPQRSRVGAAA